MRKQLLALSVAAGLTLAGGTVAATAYAADNGARVMHENMTAATPDGMGLMMGSRGMATMHDDMTAHHTADMDSMHKQMLQAMPEDQRAACADAHEAMTSDGADGEGRMQVEHDQHHPED